MVTEKTARRMAKSLEILSGQKDKTEGTDKIFNEMLVNKLIKDNYKRDNTRYYTFEKLTLVKIVRVLTGWGIKQAKDYVDKRR